MPWRVVAAVVLALALCACGDAPGLGKLAVGERGRVVEVRSGHALVLDSGLEVRLAGIEAPALSAPYGPEAKAALSDLVLGQPVELLYGGRRRDRYGRALAQVRLVKGRRWVEGAMLDAGAAQVRTWSDNRAMAAAMLEAEAKARQAGRGLWALPGYRVLLPNEARSARGFHIVEGRVARVTRAVSGVYLDFTEGGMAVRIDARAAADFAASGKAPAMLAGKIVRVRGAIYSGPMTLDHPEALEVLE